MVGYDVTSDVTTFVADDSLPTNTDSASNVTIFVLTNDYTPPDTTIVRRQMHW